MKTDPNESRMSSKPLLGLLISTILLVSVVTGAVVAIRWLVADEATIDTQPLVAEAQGYSQSERHTEVVRVLEPHLGVLSENEDVAALRLFARSRALVPEQKNRHLGTAVAVYRRIVMLDPADTASLRRMTDIYTDSGQTEDAIRYARRSIEAEPDNTDWKLGLARLLIENSGHDEAQSIVDNVLASEPLHRDALEVRIQSMVQQHTDDNAALRFINSYAQEQNQPSLLNELRLMLAEASGDKEVIALLLKQIREIKPTNANHSLWLATTLDRNGDSTRITEVLQQQQTADPKPLLYRYLQTNDFEKLNALLAEQKNAGTDAQLIVIRFLAEWIDGSQQLPAIASSLTNIDNEHARSWSPLLTELARPSPDATAVANALRITMKTYPSSPWLYFIKARTMLALGENDQAISNFRIAIKANPKWSQARIELARAMLEQGDPQTAFGEAAMAIRIAPNMEAAYEIAAISALQIVNRDQRLSESALNAITQTLHDIRQFATDEITTQLLTAAHDRLSGNNQSANDIVRTIIRNLPDNSASSLTLMSLLTTDPALVTEIQTRQQQLTGLTNKQLLTQATAVARKSGHADALTFLKNQETNGKALPDFTVRFVFAEVLSQVEPDKAAETWLKLASDYRDNPRVLSSIVQHPTLKGKSAAQRTVIGWLKAATGPDALTWQLAELKLQLAEDNSQKTAAAVTTRANELLRRVPTSADTYELMAIALRRLNRPQQVIEVLTRAIDARIDRPGFRLVLGELLLAEGKKESAVDHLVVAGKSANLKARQQAANLLLTAGDVTNAARLLQSLLPEEANDTDTDFATISAAAMANAQLGDATQSMKLIEPLADSTQRWFRLWVEVATHPNTPDQIAAQWLTRAADWTTSKAPRQRRLAGAWRQLASRSNAPEHWQAAASQLRQIATAEMTNADKLVLGAVFERIDKESQAEAIYSRLIDKAANQKLRAIALNNLALIENEKGQHAEAEQRVKKAMQLNPRPEFADSLATIYLSRNETRAAIRVLEESRDLWPEHARLRERLAALKNRAAE